MPSVLTEARSQCPELVEAVKAFDSLAYSKDYSQVYRDFIDWLIWQHELPQTDTDPLSEYSEKEKEYFLDAFKSVRTEVRNRVALWTRDTINEGGTGWYDPLGRLYECITSKNKSSMLGQYFTPEAVVNMMVQLTHESERKEIIRVLDPACGSGRMGLAAATHSMAHKIPVWVSMNDLDPICTKMTAINMCLNGIVGEALCMNGLDISGESYRFGYQVSPAYLIHPEETREFYRMIVLMKTGEDIKKQYIITPLPYEHTYLKQNNDYLIRRYQKAQEIENNEKREQKILEIQNEIKSRMTGTLFENDTTQLENMKIPSKISKKPKPKKSNKKDNSNDQFTLF